MINETFLSSCNAPSLISEKFVKASMSNFDIYLYLYNQIIEENEDIYYKIEDNEINFFNGVIATKDDTLNITKIYETINNKEIIIGDYQFFHINQDGNGFIKTPQFSAHSLFYYEDEFCSVLSNEIKLIVDSVESFKDTFVNYYDIEYIHEVYHLGYFNRGKREKIRDTAFKNIKRILPHDEIKIKSGKITIEQNENIKIPKWFEDWYFEDKDGLYDWYYEELIKYGDSFLTNISKNVNKITVGITGGFDSRLTLMILEKLCKKHDIYLESISRGKEDHPDVKLGGEVAKLLNIPWTHTDYETKSNLKPLPQHLREYAATFYQAQGDFDSHDYLANYSRKIENTNSFYQIGMDIYKKDSINTLINFNRWYSRRIFTSRNFYFPLFATNLELWFAMTYAKHYPKQKQYTEFIYNILKRGNPKLLDIPFAFESLPQINVKYESKEYKTTFHDPQPFLWDYQFVLTELEPILKIPFDKIDQKYYNILTKSKITPLDYFLLDKQITKILSKYAPENSNKIKEKLININKDTFYPKSRIYLKIHPNEKNYIKKRSLMKLMDYASSANFSSFESIEKYFNSKNYDSREAIYEKYDENCKNNLELNKQIEKLNDENKKLKNDIDKLLSSNSWKITKPLRKIKGSAKR